MQLLIILALLLYGGKGNAQNLLAEVKPVLESIGGEDMQKALQSAEEISSVLSAVQTFGNMATQPVQSNQGEPAQGFPLAPVSAIADRDITYGLSKYFAQN